MKFCNHSHLICLILFISGSCYLNTLNGEFVFDDTEAIVKNKDLNLNNSIINLFYNDFWGTNILSNYSHKSYRPLTVLFYRFQINLIGNKNPFYFHAVSIFLYMLVCATVYIVLNELLVKTNSKFNISLCTSILFSIHPIHTEVVASIVGQADLLCTLLYLFALVSYNRAILNSSMIYYSITIILAALAMFCKEIGITVLGLCCFYDVLFSLKQSKMFVKPFLTRLVGLVITAIGLLFIRWKIMNFSQPTFQPADNPASFAENLITRILSYNYIYFLNTLLLIWPQWLCFDWSMGCVSLLENFLDIRFIIVIMYWCATIYFITKQLITHKVHILFALSISIISFLPACNILRVGFVIAERTLFIPSLGFCFIISCGYFRLRETSYKTFYDFCFVLFCILFATRTWHRSKDWLSEYHLFTSAISICPNNAKVHYNIAKTVADRNELEYAEKEYRKAIELNPKYDQAMNNLANLLRDLGNLNEAKLLLEQAVRLRPDFAAAWMNLGIVLATLNQDNESEAAYLNALKYRRNYTDCYYNLGNLYLKLNRNEDALKAWEKAVSLNPSHSAAWSNTLVLLDGMGQQEKVLDLGNLAIAACPTSPAIYFTIANTLGKLKKWQAAESYFQTAIKLNPTNALYYSNFGVLYHRWGQLKKAVEFYETALRLDPHLTSALNNLKKIK